MKIRIVFLKQLFFKIIFIDKYLLRKFRRRDIGILKIKENYLVDIPKSGSSSIKHLAGLNSNRYKFLYYIFGFKPVHNSVIPINNLDQIKKQKKIILFIKSPEQRLYSVYKEKVLENNMPFNYSLIKNNKVNFIKKSIFPTSVDKKNNFLDFCNKIIYLKNYFTEKEYNNFFDKHLISQYEHVLNLNSYYPNIKDFMLVIYPIENLDLILGNLFGEKKILKVNSTEKNNYDYDKDLKISNIINEIYYKDKIIYQKLLESKKGFLELNFQSFKNI